MSKYIFILLVSITVLVSKDVDTFSCYPCNCQCDNGFVHFDDSCYHFSHDTEQWMVAMDVCKAIGAQLAEIGTARENTFLGNKVKALNVNFWIGGSDLLVEGVWEWFTSKTPVAYSAWSPGQPTNDKQDENCMEIWTNLDWNDETCSHLRHYICERPIEST